VAEQRLGQRPGEGEGEGARGVRHPLTGEEQELPLLAREDSGAARLLFGRAGLPSGPAAGWRA